MPSIGKQSEIGIVPENWHNLKNSND